MKLTHVFRTAFQSIGSDSNTLNPDPFGALLQSPSSGPVPTHGHNQNKQDFPRRKENGEKELSMKVGLSPPGSASLPVVQVINQISPVFKSLNPQASPRPEQGIDPIVSSLSFLNPTQSSSSTQLQLAQEIPPRPPVTPGPQTPEIIEPVSVSSAPIISTSRTHVSVTGSPGRNYETGFNVILNLSSSQRARTYLSREYFNLSFKPLDL